MLKEILKTINENSPYQFQGLEDTDSRGQNALMASLRLNHRLNLKSEEWDYLLKNSDLLHRGEKGSTALMVAVVNYNNIKYFSDEQWDYLIKQSSLKAQDNNDWDALCAAVWAGEENIAIKIIQEAMKNNEYFFNEKYFAELKGLRIHFIAEIKQLIERAEIGVIKEKIEVGVNNNSFVKQNKI